jgi:hypothetical protein
MGEKCVIGLCAAFVAIVGTAACSHRNVDGGRAASPVPVPARAAVRGRVVDRRTGGGLSGRTVIAAGHRVSTAADGSFTLPDVPALYDLAIVDAGGARVTVYQKLARRDPLLAHDAHGPVDPWNAAHSARLYGNPTIDGRPAPVATRMGFFTPTLAVVGDPVVLHWSQPDTLDGEVLAVALDDSASRSADNAPTSAAVLSGWAARRPVTVTPSMAATIDLALAPLPRRRIRGPVAVPDGLHVSALIESFRLAIAGADLPIRRDERDGLRGIDDELPDGTGLGASLCVTALAEGEGTSGAMRCRAGADGTFGLALDRPPKLTAPAHGTAFERDTVFSWTRFAGGVQVLQLAGSGREGNHPDVTIYTPDTSVSWQALAGTGVALPAACSIYQITAGGRGPYASMDEAVAPGGIGAWIPAEARWSQSLPINVTVPRWPRPEPGSFEAKLCHYSRGRVVVCTPRTNADNGEYYVLSAINNKLRSFPEFTKSIGLYCVHDCETARRFMKALRDYRAKHPAFDAEQPLDLEDC